MNQPETILSIKNLNKRYGALQALKNVSFDIHKGNVYGILGPNGSGKSTTLGIVLNVVNKTSGKYSWFGVTMETHQALKKVGAIIERPNFYPYMNGKENLELVCKIKGINYAKVNEKLELVGLTHRQNSKFSPFSLGMKQRLAIASALLNDPELILADEPTGALDSKSSRMLLESFEKLNNNLSATILMVTHDAFTASYCHRILFIKDGKVFNELVRGEDTRKQFFNKIIEVVTLLGGDNSNVL